MKASLSLKSPCQWLALAMLLIAPALVAAPKCDQMSSDVRKAVTQDPAKTLMIVEDALVINENCACEIVRAAIEASRADEDMIRQIVQTAIAVAPKMAPVITECAGVPSATAVTGDPTYSGKGGGKGAKDVLPVSPQTYAPVETSPDFAYLPGDIRGIYLMAPGGVGAIGFDRIVYKDCECETGDKKKPNRPVHKPVSRSVVVCR